MESPLPPPRLGDRNLFPHLEARAYPAHAAVSPASLAVQQAVNAAATDYMHPGVGAFLEWDQQRTGLRRLIAELINADEDDVALTAGTTRGIIDLARSIPWQPRERIVCVRSD